MPYRHHRSTRTSGTRRRTKWIRIANTTGAVAAGVNTVLDAGGAQTAGGMTLMRFYLWLQVPYVGVGDSTFVGLISGRDTDVGGGANRPPDPLNDARLPWRFYYKCLPTATGAAIDTVKVYTFDIKSRIKLADDNEMALLTLHNANAAAATYNYAFAGLWALP